MNSLGGILKHFAMETTMNGFLQIAVSKHIAAKLLWTTIVISTFCLSTWQCISAIKEYDRKPFVVVIQVNFTSI